MKNARCICRFLACISYMQSVILWLSQKESFYDPNYLQFDKIRLLG